MKPLKSQKMELTLLDRYVLYSEMLIRHEDPNNYIYHFISSPSGLCTSLARSLHSEKAYKYFILPELKDLPEIWKRKPRHSNSHWFTPFNHGPRIKILKAAIREVLRKMNYDFDNY